MFTQGTKERQNILRLKQDWVGLPGGTAAKTPYPECRGLGLIPGQGCSTWGCKELDTTERLNMHAHMRTRAHTNKELDPTRLNTHTHTHTLQQGTRSHTP